MHSLFRRECTEPGRTLETPNQRTANMAEAPKQFVLYKDNAGEWRWTLYAVNSKKIADGAEGYKNKADAIAGIRLVAKVASDASIWNGTDKKWEV